MATKIPPAVVSQSLVTGSRTSDSYLNDNGVPFDVIVRNVFVANVRFQMSRDNGANWDDVYVFTAPDVARMNPVGAALYRLTMAGGGDYTSGQADVFIGR